MLYEFFSGNFTNWNFLAKNLPAPFISLVSQITNPYFATEKYLNFESS